MALSRTAVTKKQKTIRLEFPEDWRQGIAFTSAAQKELFLQAIMTSLSTLAEDGTEFELAEIKLAETGDKYQVLINEKDNFDNMFMIYVAWLDQEHEIDQLIRLTTDLKKQVDRLISFEKQLKEQISFPPLNNLFELDPLVKLALTKIQVKTHNINNNLQQKLQHLIQLKLSRKNVDRDCEKASLNKMTPLILLKEKLIHILNELALIYFNNMPKQNGLLCPSKIADFDALFNEFAHINGVEIISNLAIHQKKLADICTLLNTFIQELRPKHYSLMRIASDAHRDSFELMSFFQTSLSQVAAEYKPSDRLFEYQNYQFTFMPAAYFLEAIVETEYCNLRTQFNETYRKNLQKEQKDLQEIKKQIMSATSLQMLVSQHVATKNQAFQTDMRPISPKEKKEAPPPSLSTASTSPSPDVIPTRKYNR